MTTGADIRIMLADDHQMMLDGIKDILAKETRYTVVAEAANGQMAYEMIEASPHGFDILITDISMPLLTGIQLCKMVKNKFQHIQVLILSMYNNPTAVKEAVLAEADGYILKSAGRAELLTALHKITDGGTYFSQDIVPIIYNQYNKEKIQQEHLALLTPREKEVLALIVKELTSEEIAEKLFISKKTVDHHRQNLLEKTGCRSTVGLVKFAIKHGIE